jgi:hypothetical protein
MTLARFLFTFVLAGFLLSGAGVPPALQCANTLRVAVMKDGSILLDGTKGSKEALERRLRALDKTNGAVWYYREDAETSPTGKQDASVRIVLDLVARHGRPMSFSSKPDFSDVDDGSGKLIARTTC